jgi:hypothetical protein
VGSGFFFIRAPGEKKSGKTGRPRQFRPPTDMRTVTQFDSKRDKKGGDNPKLFNRNVLSNFLTHLS